MAATFDDFELLQFDQDSDQESLWEFIDISDADDSDPTEPTIDSSDVLVVPAAAPIASPVSDPTQAHSRRRETRLVRLLDLPFQTPLNFDDRRGLDDVIGEEDDDEEEDEEEAGYGLDDELVPWSVSEKLGRERMRKLGKRTFAKMQNSKRSPYLVVRPGCVRGKHGLGLKHIH